MRTFWTVLLLTVTFTASILIFWPLVLLPSRWIVAPVVASRHRGTIREALGESNRLVRGHWLRSIGVLVTMGMVALVAATAGALLLLATPLSFTEAGGLTGLLSILLVPYLVLVMQEYHADLMAAHEITDDVPSPTPAPASV